MNLDFIDYSSFGTDDEDDVLDSLYGMFGDGSLTLQKCNDSCLLQQAATRGHLLVCQFLVDTLGCTPYAIPPQYQLNAAKWKRLEELFRRDAMSYLSTPFCMAMRHGHAELARWFINLPNFQVFHYDVLGLGGLKTKDEFDEFARYFLSHDIPLSARGSLIAQQQDDDDDDLDDYACNETAIMWLSDYRKIDWFKQYVPNILEISYDALEDNVIHVLAGKVYNPESNFDELLNDADWSHHPLFEEPGSDGDTVLHRFASANWERHSVQELMGMIQKIMQFANCDVNDEGEGDKTPIGLACSKRHRKMIWALMRLDANIDGLDDDDKPVRDNPIVKSYLHANRLYHTLLTPRTIDRIGVGSYLRKLPRELTAQIVITLIGTQD